VSKVQASLGLSVSVIDQLTAIAAGKFADGYLRAYANDLHVIDRDTLEKSKAGDRFVWALRDCGTQLFQVASGHDSIWLTYWLDQGDVRDTPTLCWSVVVGGDSGASGDVHLISRDRARALASIPHPEGKRVVVSLLGRQ
jgi:hypothetical protein